MYGDILSLNLALAVILTLSLGVTSQENDNIIRATEGDDVTIVLADRNTHLSKLDFISCRFGHDEFIHFSHKPFVVQGHETKIEILMDYLENKGFAFLIKNIQASDIVYNYSCQVRFAGEYITNAHSVLVLDSIPYINIEHHKNDTHDLLVCEVNCTTRPEKYNTSTSHTWYSGYNISIGSQRTLDVAMTTSPGPYACAVTNGAARRERRFERLSSPTIRIWSVLSEIDKSTVTFKCQVNDVRKLHYHWAVDHVDFELLTPPKYNVIGQYGNQLTIVDMTSHDNPVTCAVGVAGDVSVQNESTSITVNDLRNDTSTERIHGENNPNQAIAYSMAAIISGLLVVGGIILFICLRHRRRTKNSTAVEQNINVSDYLTTTNSIRRHYENTQSATYAEITESAIYSAGSGVLSPRKINESSHRQRMKTAEKDKISTYELTEKRRPLPKNPEEKAESEIKAEHEYMSLKDDSVEISRDNMEEEGKGEGQSDEIEENEDSQIHKEHEYIILKDDTQESVEINRDNIVTKQQGEVDESEEIIDEYIHTDREPMHQ